MDTGHYKSYCKVRGSWFLFDDHIVTKVDVEQVLDCEVYMCFYGKQHLDYIADKIP